MVFIRADSNSTISGGHIMRCLAIAKSVMGAGENVCFLLADDNPIPILQDAGLDYIVLDSDWQDLMSDVYQVKEIVQHDKNPLLLIDTYSVTRQYVEALRPFTKIAYLGSKREYLGNLDLLINYSTDIDYDFYNKYYSSNTTLLLGPSYAPLREEFQQVRKDYRNNILRVLLTTGNTDKNNLVDMILKKLLPLVEQTDIVFDVVVGRMFDEKDYLHETYDDNKNVHLHENVKSMSLLMRECDLAISANGTTVYELSAIGLPTITFAMVPEQVRSAEALSQLGVIDYCGRIYEDKENCVEFLKNRFTYYMRHNDDMISLAKKAHAIIDGNGCKKIGDEIFILVK